MIPDEKIREIAHRRWNTSHTTPEDIEAAIREALAEVEKGKCVWSPDSFDDERIWMTGCGKEIMMTEGTPKENGYAFCPFCGKRLTTGEKGDRK